MRLIIDANILISAMIRTSVTRKIIVNSIFELYTPEYTFSEIEKNLYYISNKNSLTLNDNKKVLEILSNYIHIFDAEFYIGYLGDAGRIIGKIDEKDIPYIALALAINNDGIWTNDEHFQKQNKIKVWKTKEIIKQL